MLFSKKRLPRLSEAEVEQIRRRAQAIPARFRGKSSNLADTFARFGESDFGFALEPGERLAPAGIECGCAWPAGAMSDETAIVSVP